MKTIDEVCEYAGIIRTEDGINLHFSPIPNWYGCFSGFDCPICGNPIDWKWIWNGQPPQITTRAPQKQPLITGAEYLTHAHRYLKMKCNGCGTIISAENYD